MKKFDKEIDTTSAQATTPLHVVLHIENSLRKPAGDRYAERLDFIEKHFKNLVLFDDQAYILVEAIKDRKDTEPDDYNLASIEAVGLPYITKFEAGSPADRLAGVLKETAGTTLIGIPTDALWDLDRSLHPSTQQTHTAQVLGLMAVHAEPTR